MSTTKTNVPFLCIWIWIFTSCLLVTSSQNVQKEKTPILIGYLTGSLKSPSNVYYKKLGQAISGAITLAINEINKDDSVLPNHSLEMVIAETYGEELVSVRETAQLPSRNISVYIGPQETCVHEGRIAAAFNIPMISYFCTQYEVSDKLLYPTFARTRPPDSQISKSVVSILKTFNWKKVTFIHRETDFEHIADYLNELLEKNDIQVSFRKRYEGPYFHQHGENPFIKIVQDTYIDTRIYVMLGAYFEFVGLMDHLQRRGLLDTGEYYVIGVHIGQYDPKDPQKYLEGIFDKKPENTSVQAFRSYLGIMHSSPIYPWFQNFTVLVNNYLEAPPFNFFNPYGKHGKNKILRPEAAYLYDAVWLYARAAHQAIQEGVSPANGTAIFELIKETTYKSAMGYINRIDTNGDAEGNYTLIARKQVPGRPGEWGVYPVGHFLLNKNTSRLPVFEMYHNETIDWVGDGPPIDEPPCGFRGERCIPEPSHTAQIVGGAVGGVLLIIVIVVIVLYRNWRYEQELQSLLWKIDYKELNVPDVPCGNFTPTISTNLQTANIDKTNILRGSRMSLVSTADFEFKQVFARICNYRNSVVAIKKINKRNVDLTREVRKELKVIRSIRQDNLTTFIGACIDTGNICIVTEYCSKGSLQDILENEEIKLDAMFIASLVFDIIKAMIYIHESEIRFHGRLKSSNCVVDSRWVLKITDFGLQHFRDGAEPDRDMTEHSYYQSLLWTSPELLRTLDMPVSGSQKGDIYSFAIILYEIEGRDGPYGDCELSPKEIVRRVRDRPDRSGVIFRPKLSELNKTPKFVTECIKDCWCEEATERPDFKSIRTKLKAMQKGMKPNIFDNMMAIMEKYANNLETIVEERTDQLQEEKKKTEELLHQMLPQSVAEQLKLGKRVEAEAFDSVTIYFSDICGFTSMSSESTPMQVVDLLNDLYTTFDSILENYDVYKVETIGDAYMVVSGLPKANGLKHAGEIASMSLHLLSAIKKFRIKHRPNDTLKLRIGIHSGPCVSGVVGLKMPRYCLFGDTVNTASRMESNGLPLKIHCSPECKLLLDKLGGYGVEERGLVTMKGKGEIRTFWVTSGSAHRKRSISTNTVQTLCSSEAPDLTTAIESTESQAPPSGGGDVPADLGYSATGQNGSKRNGNICKSKLPNGDLNQNGGGGGGDTSLGPCPSYDSLMTGDVGPTCHPTPQSGGGLIHSCDEDTDMWSKRTTSCANEAPFEGAPLLRQEMAFKVRPSREEKIIDETRM